MPAQISVYISGPHANRMPLAYPALADLFAGVVRRVDAPEDADMAIFTHVLDIQSADARMVRDWRRRRRPVVLLSEEPFWDTIWGRRPLEPRIMVETASGVLPVVQLSHQTTAIYRFDRIPYYLLTDHRFAATYLTRFRRNADITPRDWADRFAARPIDTCFMFERRPEAFHSVAWPEADLAGLCAWRTEFAEAFADDGTERLGQSWNNGTSRFTLDNWHLDKMVRLDGRARAFGALENTHQPDYVTEKAFDAFANGGIPLYLASPGHRFHDFGLPAESWINLHGRDPQTAAVHVSDRLAELAQDGKALDAYADAQDRLARLFGDARIWVAERDRLRSALLAELGALARADAPERVAAAG